MFAYAGYLATTMSETESGVVGVRAAELKQINSAERTGQPFLYWRTPDAGLQITYLGADRWRVTIGRAEEADVRLEADSQVSRMHALLERVGEEWTLVDDGLSRNGSFVNAERVLARKRLADRDRLCFGSSEVVYRAGVPRSAAPTVSAGEDAGSMTLSPAQRRVLLALCRPMHARESAMPATNRAIAAEVLMSVDAVKAHLRSLFEIFGLSELPQNEKRARLAATALVSGVLSAHEF